MQHNRTIKMSFFFFYLNQMKRTATKFERLQNKRKIIRIVCENSTGYLLQLCKIGIF